jgi:hypothetical protein
MIKRKKDINDSQSIFSTCEAIYQAYQQGGSDDTKYLQRLHAICHPLRLLFSFQQKNQLHEASTHITADVGNLHRKSISARRRR